METWGIAISFATCQPESVHISLYIMYTRRVVLVQLV